MRPAPLRAAVHSPGPARSHRCHRTPSPSRRRGEDGRTLLVVLFLGLLPTILFGRCLLFGLTLAYDDLSYWFYPWKMLLRVMASQHHIGFWLPFDFSGMPHVADIQRQIFYPLNTVFFFLPTRVAMVVFVGLHFFVASLLMYAFLRTMSLSEEMGVLPATCGAVIYAFSAFPLLHLTQLPVLASYVWIPGLLLAVEAWWRRPSAAVLASGALVYCMMVLGGAPQVVFIATCLCGSYGLLLAALSGWSQVESPRAASGLGRWSLLVAGMVAIPLLGVALSALQLLPMAELASYSTRQQEVPSAYSSIGTAEPRMVATLLSAYVFGNPRSGNYTGPAYSYHEVCFYMGFLTVLLVGAALGALPRNRAQVVFFAVASVLGVVIALGNHLHLGPYGLHDLTRQVIPLFGKFRVPPRWIILTVTGCAVLAAVGLNSMARFRHRHVVSAPEGAAGGARSALVAAILTGVAAFGCIFWCFVGRADVRAEWLWMTLIVAAVLATLALTWFGITRMASTCWVLTAVLALDLMVFGWRYVLFTSPPENSRGLQVLRDLATRPGPARVLTHTDVAIPTQIATYAAVFGVENIQGTNPLFLRPYFEYLYFSQTGDLPSESDTGYMHHNGFFVMGPVQNNMTRLLNARWRVGVSGSGRGGEDGSVMVPDVGLRVDELQRPFGAALFVPGHRVVDDRRRLYALLRSSSFRPDREVLFREPPGVTPSSGRDDVPASVTLVQREADRIHARVVAPTDGFVLFSEVCYPGWRATVDGVESPILQGNGIFRTLFVRRGSHEVTLRYVPDCFRAGLAISVLTALGLGLGMVVSTLGRRRRNRKGSPQVEACGESDG